MTTRKELDNRMEADSFLTSKGVLSPQQRSSSGDAMLAELTRASQEAMSSGLPMIWVPGQGFKPDPDPYLEGRMAGPSAKKKR